MAKHENIDKPAFTAILSKSLIYKKIKIQLNFVNNKLIYMQFYYFANQIFVSALQKQK